MEIWFRRKHTGKSLLEMKINEDTLSGLAKYISGNVAGMKRTQNWVYHFGMITFYKIFLKEICWEGN